MRLRDNEQHEDYIKENLILLSNSNIKYTTKRAIEKGVFWVVVYADKANESLANSVLISNLFK